MSYVERFTRRLIANAERNRELYGSEVMVEIEPAVARYCSHCYQQFPLNELVECATRGCKYTLCAHCAHHVSAYCVTCRSK